MRLRDGGAAWRWRGACWRRPVVMSRSCSHPALNTRAPCAIASSMSGLDGAEAPQCGSGGALAGAPSIRPASFSWLDRELGEMRGTSGPHRYVQQQCLRSGLPAVPKRRWQLWASPSMLSRCYTPYCSMCCTAAAPAAVAPATPAAAASSTCSPCIVLPALLGSTPWCR